MKNHVIALPYPIVDGKINQVSLNALMEVFAGQVSEFTLEQTYRYAYFMALGELRQVLKEILSCKRTHIYHLAETIVYFGGLPLFSGEKNFWSGGYVNYLVGKSCINNLILQEEAVIAKYNKIIESEQNLSIKKLISRFIMDSQLHITLLRVFVEDN